MAIASDRTGTPKRRHGIADSMPAFAYHAMRPQRTRIASRCDGPGASQADRRAIWPIPHHQTNPTAPTRDMAVAPRADNRTDSTRSTGIHPPCNQTITPQPDTAPANHHRNEKPSACAEKSLSVGRRLSITGNHGIWRLISTITCRQTRNAPNQACHTSLPAAFAAATSASSWASLASDSPVMNFSTRAFASLSSC